MKLQLNGEVIETQAGTLADVLETQGFGTAKVATAVNGDFVPIAARASRTLRDGDRIEVLAPMQGG